MQYTYTQQPKNLARHSMLKQAVISLTALRNNSSCISFDYVRNLYEHFMSDKEGKDYSQVKNIDIQFINEWEKLRSDKIGYKKPSDLIVCYLSGPQPQNDFDELISLGVLPQNIYAFEMDSTTYAKALSSYNTTDFNQPKLIKMSIEKFFEFTPKKFDIVYIDACGALISDKNALRCIATMFKHHRLNSPSALITNFAQIDSGNISETSIYKEMLSKYFLTKNRPNTYLMDNNGTISFRELTAEMQEDISTNLDFYYGEFITSVLFDIASTCTPAIRFANSDYWRFFIDTINTSRPTVKDVNLITTNSVMKFLKSNELFKSYNQADICTSKVDKLSSQISGLPQQSRCIVKSFDIIHQIKSGINLKPSVEPLLSYFNDENIYPFLDEPTKDLFIDLSINQYCYPMHYVSEQTKRLMYKAKDTTMYMDLIIFDEVRYVYDWMPTFDQIPNAFKNLSWQYIFRFAVDGMVKQRLNYNNEFFYRGSVVSKAIKGFECKSTPKREEVGG